MEQDMFLQAVAEACGISYVDELYGRSQRNIVRCYLLDQLVKQAFDRESKVLSAKFMNFMADYGQYCVQQDQKSGELLMEIALQRITQGGIAHADYDCLLALDEPYWNYSAADDEERPLDAACVGFLVNNLKFCLDNLSNETWHHHAELIKEGIIIRVSGGKHLCRGAYRMLPEVVKTLL